MSLLEQSTIPLGYRLPPGQAYLPCRLLVITDLGVEKAARQPESYVSIDRLLERYQPSLDLEGDGWSVTVKVQCLDDLAPQNLVQQLTAQRKTQAMDDLDYLHQEQQELVLLNRVLHHPRLRQLEASWRSLDKLLQQFRHSDRVEVRVLHRSQQELSDELTQTALLDSDLFELVYSSELGQYGGQPYSALLLDYEWQMTTTQLQLLESLGHLGQLAHLPVLTAISAAAFGMKDFSASLTQEKLDEISTGRRYLKLRQLMASSAARYLLLGLPRVLLRPPHQLHLGQAWFQEVAEKGEEPLVWGNPAYPLAGMLLHSFQQLGAYTGLLETRGSQDRLYQPLQLYTAHLGQAPLETQWSQARVAQMTQLGLTPLVAGGQGDALTCEMPVMLQAAAQDRDGVHPDNQLIYLMTVCRVAHYLKQALRELLGSTVLVEEVEAGLNQWLQSLVSAQERPTAEVMHRKPFRSAQVHLARTASGETEMQLQLEPHLKYQGESFALTLAANLPGETYG
jgi:type VI secretion system protein ImpC